MGFLFFTTPDVFHQARWFLRAGGEGGVCTWFPERDDDEGPCEIGRLRSPWTGGGEGPRGETPRECVMYTGPGGDTTPRRASFREAVGTSGVAVRRYGLCIPRRLGPRRRTVRVRTYVRINRRVGHLLSPPLHVSVVHT